MEVKTLELASTNSMAISLEMIRNGEAGLNQHRRNLLSRVPQIGDWVALPLESVSDHDVAYVSAAVCHEFALLRGREKDILLHGEPYRCIFDEALIDLLKTKKFRLVIHSHPDYGIVTASREDRQFLKTINQKSSRIISFITGEISEFKDDLFEDL